MASVNFTASVDLDQRPAQQLHLEHEEDLFLLMVQAHLSLPRLADQATEAMVSDLQQLV